MRKTASKTIAMGGMMAAMAVVVMSLGGLIPVATFVCPMICMLLLAFVARFCGGRIGWAWYGAVTLLSFLMGPDKEAAAVFAFLGSYPLVKPKLEKMPLAWLWKAVFFNVLILAMYWLLINLLGLDQIREDYEAMGLVMTGVMLLLGNVTFFLLDLVLTRFQKVR